MSGQGVAPVVGEDKVGVVSSGTLPSGTVTFLFTDIEGSTRLWESAPTAMAEGLALHDEIVRSSIEGFGGRVFATGGDGFAAVFRSAPDAAGAAVNAQSKLTAAAWPHGAAIRVRMGVHSGEAVERGGDYFGSAVNRAARLMAIAHGGQVLCSAATAGLLGDDVPLVVLGEHRLRDLSAPVMVFQVGAGSFPPLRSLDSIPLNLPTMRTELVGRDDDIDAFATSVHTNRLVTLTGVGGVGKTRLALAVAGTVAPEFPDGCWLVELAPLGDAADVVRAVGIALGASNAMVTDTPSLVRYLERRRLLLVVDNCEHVLDATAELVESILDGAPEVHLLATSREPLGVDGEVVRRVRSLMVADTESGEDVGSSPAVRLFVARAQAVNDAFTLGEGNVDDVVAICRHLDGIPLAIELAAARTGAMSPAEIARRLDDRFRVLAGARRAQERHRTLQAAVGWSYDLLTATDRAVFARLSVYPATFDLAAAVAVAGGGEVDADDVVDAVVRLVDRSLVVHDEPTGRYRLLETLRQYGAERLAERDESDQTRDRYTEHYRALIAAFGPGMSDHRYDESCAILTPEIDNVRATVDWFVRTARWRDAARLIVDAPLLFLSFLSLGETVERTRVVLDNSDEIDAQTRADFEGILGEMAVGDLRFEEGTRLAEHSVQLAGAIGVAVHPWAHWAIAQLVIYDELPAGIALTHADAAAHAADVRQDRFSEVTALATGGYALWKLGRRDDAEERERVALDRARHLGNPLATSYTLLWMFPARLFTNDGPALAELATLFDEHGSTAIASLRRRPSLFLAWMLIWRSLVHAPSQPAIATRDAVDAARLADRLGNLQTLDWAVSALSYACASGGDRDTALALDAYVAASPTALSPAGRPIHALRTAVAHLDAHEGEAPRVPGNTPRAVRPRDHNRAQTGRGPRRLSTLGRDHDRRGASPAVHHRQVRSCCPARLLSPSRGDDDCPPVWRLGSAAATRAAIPTSGTTNSPSERCHRLQRTFASNQSPGSPSRKKSGSSSTGNLADDVHDGSAELRGRLFEHTSSRRPAIVTLGRERRALPVD